MKFTIVNRMTSLLWENLLTVVMVSASLTFNIAQSQVILAPSTATCPTGCACRPRGDDVNIMWEVKCEAVNSEDVQKQLAQVSANTTRLTLIAPHFPFDTLTFSHLSDLKELTVAHSDLRSLQYDYNSLLNEDLFVGLHSLISLSINVILVEAKPEVFAPLVALTKLDLSNSRIFYFRKLLTLFEHFPHLPIEELRLRNFQRPYGNIRRIVMKDFLLALSKFPLKLWDMSENGIVAYSPGLIEFLPRLEVFIFTHNLLDANHDDDTCIVLDFLLHPALRHVDISDFANIGAPTENNRNRRRRKVEMDAWRHVNHHDVITATDLAHGHDHFEEQRARVGEHTGRQSGYQQRHTYYSKTLNHSRKKRSVLDALSDGCPFDHSLSWSKIACQRIGCFCANLTTIPCRLAPTINNVIAEYPDCLKGIQLPLPPRLEFLSFHHNAQFSDLDQFQNDVTFCVGGNEVKYLDVSYVNFGGYLNPFNVTFLGFGNVKYLNLQYNALNINNYKILRGFHGVEILFLGGNNISLGNAAATSLFEGLTKIRSLDLADNGLTAIHSGVFDSLINLESLNLSNNALTTLEWLIGAPPSLRELNARDNNIAALSTAIMTKFEENYLSVDLTGNLLSCSCLHLEFVHWVQTVSGVLVGRNNYYCSHPLTGRVPIENVDLEVLEAHCHPSYTSIAVSSSLGCGGGILLSCLVFLGYKKRWRIRFYLYAARRAWGKYRNNARVGDFVNDAFVIYNSEDRAWVHDTLRVQLEEVHGLKLCIHYRDFIPGHNIEDEIVNSIEASRKTLVVLSPSFLESSWCSFEMQMARMKYISEGLDVLVLVILRDLPVTGVNKTLSRLLESKTYMKWDEDRDAQLIFWDQLVRALQED